MSAQRDQRQADVFAWAKAAFTAQEATSLPQRGLRLLEEAIEAFQATGGNPGLAHRLVDHVFARPSGELQQELGGVGVCVLALAAAASLSADDAERLEVERVLGKPLEHFQRRNAQKNAAGFLVADLSPETLAAQRQPDDLRDCTGCGQRTALWACQGCNAPRYLRQLDQTMHCNSCRARSGLPPIDPTVITCPPPHGGEGGGCLTGFAGRTQSDGTC